MQLSQKSNETVDACRFCWMCHHICPIGTATGQERHSQRARALSLSLITRSAATLSEDIAANLYECALCGGCVQSCITGWDPVQFVKESRLVAALSGTLPPYIREMLDNFEETGNIYGAQNLHVAAKPQESDTLFFLGTDARILGADKAVALMQQFGAAVLDTEPDSGLGLSFLIGAADETKRVMEKAAEVLSGYQTIVCYDPQDAALFLHTYKEWDISLDAEIVTFTSYLANKLPQLKPKKGTRTYTFQDPFALSRDLNETTCARDILNACGNTRDMLLCKEETMLAGHAILSRYMPVAMEEVAKSRWENFQNIGGEVLVTASPAEYAALAAVKPENAELLRIEEVLEACL